MPRFRLTVYRSVGRLSGLSQSVTVIGIPITGLGPYETVGRFFGAGLAPPPRYRPFAPRPIPTVVSQYVTAWYGCAAVVSPCPWCFEPSSRVFLFSSVLKVPFAAQAMPPRLSSSIRRPAFAARPTEWPAGTHRSASGARLSFCSGRRAPQRPLSGESASARSPS